MKNIRKTFLAVSFIIAAMVGAFATKGMAQTQSTNLKSYVFDDPIPVVTLPDVMNVLQDGSGRIRLSRSIKFSGEYAVELQSLPHDPMAAQLNSLLPKRRIAPLFLHFAMLPTADNQPIAITLGNVVLFNDPSDATFYLQLHSEKSKLLQLHPFRWHLIDLIYDVDRQAVEVIVRDESALQPLVQLHKSLAVQSHEQSASELHFVAAPPGQKPPASESHFFLDDVLLTTNANILNVYQAAAVRRKKFMEILRDINISTLQTHCMTPSQLDEIGIPTHELLLHKTAKAGGDDALTLIRSLLAGKNLSPAQQRQVDADAALKAIPLWLAACRSDIAKTPRQALELFDQALKLVPHSKLYTMSKALALAELQEWQAIDALLSPIQQEWMSDPRYMVFMAMIGKVRASHTEQKRFHYEASQFVQHKTVFENVSSSLFNYHFIADQYVYYKFALDPASINNIKSYVEMVAIHHNGYHSYQALWLERFADIWLIKSDLNMARFIYELAYEKWPESLSLHMKLADLYFMARDQQSEENVRRRIVTYVNKLGKRL